MAEVKNLAWVAVLALIAVGGCGGSELASDDPHGHEACRFLDASRAEDASTEEMVGGVLVAGEEASKAKTVAIRNASEVLITAADNPTTGEDIFMADVDVLHAACTEAGYEFEHMEN